MNLTSNWVGISSLCIFAVAYAFVIFEEFIDLRKSKPVMLAAGSIWALIGIHHWLAGSSDNLEIVVRESLAEFAELFLFLVAAMTYVNSMSERRVFDALRCWLINRKFSERSLFWLTGIISFFLSAMIDNLTATLVMSSVILAVGAEDERFKGLSCINVVVAANAGGAFSPFGDITTLMVWQSGAVQFFDFPALILPSAMNYLLPALLLSLGIPPGRRELHSAPVAMRRGAKRIMLLFAITVAIAVIFKYFMDLPPFLGMMMGLALLQLFGYYLRRSESAALSGVSPVISGELAPFDGMREIARVEWDTLLFFFGVIMSVGGLAYIGYLELLSSLLYSELGPTVANIFVGIVSSVIDNIPVMVAVLHMNPEMDLQQWLLVTLTAGTGGSLLSIGSAAGVAMMGQARGSYTFFTHLRWMPAIAAGYALGIVTHLLIN